MQEVTDSEAEKYIQVLAKYEPSNANWREAEQRMHEYALLKEKQLKASKVQDQGKSHIEELVEHIRSLVPEEAKSELENLNIREFALGIIFYEPFMQYQHVFHGYSAEVYIFIHICIIYANSNQILCSMGRNCH